MWRKNHKVQGRCEMRRYGPPVQVARPHGPSLALITNATIRSKPSGFSSDASLLRWDLDDLLRRRTLSLYRAAGYFARCAVIGCECKDLEVHPAKAQHRRVMANGQLSILSSASRQR